MVQDNLWDSLMLLFNAFGEIKIKKEPWIMDNALKVVQKELKSKLMPL